MHKNTRCILGNPLKEENPATFLYLRVSIKVNASLSMPLENAQRVKAQRKYKSIDQMNNQEPMAHEPKAKVHYPLSQEPHKDIDPNDLTMNINYNEE